MTPRQKMFAILACVFLIVIIIDLVRRRKLREEFSWLWLMAGAVIMILSIWDSLLISFAKFIGIETPVSAILFFAIVFIFSIALHFSIKISSLTNQIKNLAQEIALCKIKCGKGADDKDRK
ncbi:MAG: DUF2304 domain-containing protein [Candidatus Omnitrophota bacterium]|nr:DUF2304 domain-containing protein [Candidatus Omnitrophota bacterium]MBU1928554.1 DUF2304 domain-containing protein [Candidatus Omnitrophota bacterium]MBU2034914.1 DUF2304 domain-containing protein [Candidatus Omnitrophota bacterium]